MKILSIEQIREADNYTMKHEPISSIDLMERAATACFKWLKKRLNPSQNVKIFCGKGNNGGDGLVIARLLHTKGFLVEVYIINHSKHASKDFIVNRNRLKEFKNLKTEEISDSKYLPKLSKDDIIIDAIFGSGLSKPITGFISHIINNINESKAICISIDTPSGLFSDLDNSDNDGSIIKADYTLTFQFPKYSFLLPENDKFVGDWQLINIDLHKDYIRTAQTNNYYILLNDVSNIIKKRKKFEHKGNFGHALLIAGSLGKIGASVLASQACLRSGVGLLTTHIPQCGYPILQTTTPEAMVSLDESNLFFSGLKHINQYSAIGIGPGIGIEEETQKAFKLLIQNSTAPLIIDADAINILSENKTWIAFLPQNSILTPHPKEFERLTEKVNSGFERLQAQREFSIKHQVYIVLKGAHTSISTPTGNLYFNSTGNPGMATAGSGDVLTGIILSLAAQGYSNEQAAILGVFLHGLSGDFAAEKNSPETVIASDIIKHLKNAFQRIHETN